MSRNKSEFVSAAGTAFEIVKALSDTVSELGGDDKDLRRVLSDKKLCRDVAEVIVGSSANGTLLGSFPITVRYDKTVEELKELRGWTYWNSNVNSNNFPSPDVVVDEVTIELIKFDEWGTTADRERQLAARGLELPNMHQQLGFAAEYPDAWDGKLVVFLGAAWVGPSGDREVGYLYGEGGRRSCRLGWGGPDDRWNPGYVFAGVRK